MGFQALMLGVIVGGPILVFVIIQGWIDFKPTIRNAVHGLYEAMLDDK